MLTMSKYQIKLILKISDLWTLMNAWLNCSSRESKTRIKTLLDERTRNVKIKCLQRQNTNKINVKKIVFGLENGSRFYWDSSKAVMKFETLNVEFENIGFMNAHECLTKLFFKKEQNNDENAYNVKTPIKLILKISDLWTIMHAYLNCSWWMNKKSNKCLQRQNTNKVEFENIWFMNEYECLTKLFFNAFNLANQHRNQYKLCRSRWDVSSGPTLFDIWMSSFALPLYFPQWICLN